MSLRWTLALVALAAALGAWVDFGEIRGDVRKQEADAEQKRVFGVEPKSVTAIEFVSPDGVTARVARAGDTGWKLESPVAYPADPDAVERALKVLTKIQSTSSISPMPSDLGPFGLGAAGHKVRVFAGDGAPQELTVGRPAPVGGVRYLSLGSDSGRIFTVTAGDVFGLMPSVSDLRDKRLLHMATGAADELTVRAKGALVAHAKRGDAGWQLVEPEAVPADAEKIRRTLDELALARAKDFSDAPDQATKDAIAKPELELVLHAPDGDETLTFGHAAGKVWLARSGDPVLLEVNPAALTAIPAKTFDYRAKRVFTLQADQVHAAELSYPRTGATHRFELTDKEWKSTEPGVELQPLKVEDMLFAVASLDATGLEPADADRSALGLLPPVVTIRALDDKGQELGVLSLGNASPDKGIPAVSSQNVETWRISNDVGSQVPLSPEAFTNLFVKKPGDSPATAPGMPSSP